MHISSEAMVIICDVDIVPAVGALINGMDTFPEAEAVI